MRNSRKKQRGFTIIELLMALAVAALMMTALTGVIAGALNVRDDSQARTEATRQLRFAMDRMVRAARGGKRLLLPLADNPDTNWRENVREQTVPASPPEGDSTLATAVLAVTLDPIIDLDQDGYADSDNDRDGLTDEDTAHDNTNDAAAGITNIDDDGDGLVDESSVADNDEDGVPIDDWLDTFDNDGDGSIDEDLPADVNYDNKAGIADIDDDGDGSVDEGSPQDDDEDGVYDEDWLDPVVFFLSGSTLVERRPDLDPVDGNDYTEYVLADNITRFRVERTPDTGSRAVLVNITLEISLPELEPISLDTRVRIGGGS